MSENGGAGMGGGRVILGDVIQEINGRVVFIFMLIFILSLILTFTLPLPISLQKMAVQGWGGQGHLGRCDPGDQWARRGDPAHPVRGVGRFAPRRRGQPGGQPGRQALRRQTHARRPRGPPSGPVIVPSRRPREAKVGVVGGGGSMGLVPTKAKRSHHFPLCPVGRVVTSHPM